MNLIIKNVVGMGLCGFVFHQETNLKYHSHVGGCLFKHWKMACNRLSRHNFFEHLSRTDWERNNCNTMHTCLRTSVHTLQKCIPVGKLIKRETIKSSDGA